MTGRPADHPRPDHTCTRHTAGARACYVRHACRCRACTTTYSNWQARHQAGLTTRIPIATVHTHLERLRATGMTDTDIATAARIPESTLRTIRRGGVRSVNRDTARAILATTTGVSRRGYVDSTGSARRLQALSAIGWDSAMVADHIGVTPSRVRAIRAHERPEIHATTRNMISAAYDELSMTLPPDSMWVTRSRTWASRHGWPPPLAWDDDTIDDPEAKPQCGATVTWGATVEDVTFLIETGETLVAIAHRLGLTVDSIYSALHRHHRQDLIQRLKKAA